MWLQWLLLLFISSLYDPTHSQAQLSLPFAEISFHPTHGFLLFWMLSLEMKRLHLPWGPELKAEVKPCKYSVVFEDVCGAAAAHLGWTCFGLSTWRVHFRRHLVGLCRLKRKIGWWYMLLKCCFLAYFLCNILQFVFKVKLSAFSSFYQASDLQLKHLTAKQNSLHFASPNNCQSKINSLRDREYTGFMGHFPQ